MSTVGIAFWSITLFINIGLLIFNISFLIRSIDKLKMVMEASRMIDFGFIYIDYHIKHGRISNAITDTIRSNIKINILIIDKKTMEIIEERESILINIDFDYRSYSDIIINYKVSDISEKIIIKDDVERSNTFNRKITEIIENHVGDIDKEYIAVIDQTSINNKGF